VYETILGAHLETGVNRCALFLYFIVIGDCQRILSASLLDSTYSPFHIHPYQMLKMTID